MLYNSIYAHSSKMDRQPNNEVYKEMLLLIVIIMRLFEVFISIFNNDLILFLCVTLIYTIHNCSILTILVYFDHE